MSARHVIAVRLQAQQVQASVSEFRPVERGWCLGSEEFREELLAATGTMPPTHYGTEKGKRGHPLERMSTGKKVFVPNFSFLNQVYHCCSGKCQFSLFKLLTAVAEFWQVGGDAASTAP